MTIAGKTDGTATLVSARVAVPFSINIRPEVLKCSAGFFVKNSYRRILFLPSLDGKKGASTNWKRRLRWLKVALSMAESGTFGRLKVADWTY